MNNGDLINALIYAYNEYLEALHLERLHQIYHDLFNPPYYFVCGEVGLKTLHCYQSKLIPYLLEWIEKVLHPKKKPETILDEYVKAFGWRGALPRLINQFVVPEKPLGTKLWTNDWGQYQLCDTKEKDFIYAYYFYFVMRTPEPIQRLFGGDRFTDVYMASDFIKHFQNKLPCATTT